MLAVGLETGGLSMRGLVDAGRYRVRLVDVGPLFHLRGYLSCGAESEHLAQGAAAMDYLVVVDENRSAQVAAAPEILPATASFYRALADGTLGFREAFRTVRMTRGDPAAEDPRGLWALGGLEKG